MRHLRKPNCMLEIILLDDRKIRILNKKYKNIDQSTDVLSFDISGREFGVCEFSGCIFISLDKALSNSRRYGTKFGQELFLYVIHGVLHLCGYDDGSASERKRMRRAGELPGRKARAHQNHRRAWGYRPAQQSDDQDAPSFGLGWLEAGRTAALCFGLKYGEIGIRRPHHKGAKAQRKIFYSTLATHFRAERLYCDEGKILCSPENISYLSCFASCE